MKPKVDTARLKRLLSESGSLEGAVQARRKEKNALEEDMARLRGEHSKLEGENRDLEKRLETLRAQVAEQRGLLEQLSGLVQRQGWQYRLFESLIAMLGTSPSRPGTLRDMVSFLDRLERSGWHTASKPGELRGIFIRAVLGYYLRCFQCGGCGARFILNAPPVHQPLSAPCTCPSCGSATRVKEDGSFLEAMLSPGRVEDLTREQALQQEIDRLRPLEALQDVPCATCGKAIHIGKLSREEAIRLTRTWHHAACPESATARMDAAIESALYRKLSPRFASDNG